MTRRGANPGFKPRHSGGNGPTAERDDEAREAVRVIAKWYLYRTGNRDLWEVLGLAEEPAAAQTRKARALAAMSHKRPPDPVRHVQAGHCPLCNKPIPKSGVCRKTSRCRDAVARKELET